jgi:catechol 2,3-dioxygenase-like lactoylglutathione lyase family enzyme
MIVADAEKSRRFYEDTLGWRSYYDAQMNVTGKIIPVGEPGARVQLYIMEGHDKPIGKVGILQWLDPPLPAPPPPKQHLGIGDVVFVADVDDMPGLAARVGENPDCRMLCPPRDWSFPAPDGSGDIDLSSMSFFDPDGYLHEVYYRYNRPNPEGYLIRRTTALVRDMDRCVAFYRDALGMTVYQDSVMTTEGMELPTGHEGARVRLVVFKSEDPYIGMVGALQFLDPILADPRESSWNMGIGKVVFVAHTSDADGVFQRVDRLGVRVTGRPFTRSVPRSGGEGETPMTSMGFYDSDGQLFEVNQR